MKNNLPQSILIYYKLKNRKLLQKNYETGSYHTNLNPNTEDVFHILQFTRQYWGEHTAFFLIIMHYIKFIFYSLSHNTFNKVNLL